MIDIKRKDGTVRLSVEFSDSSLYRKELMVEEYAMLYFSTDSIVRFSKGDYIETEFGKFEIVTVNRPKENINTGGFDYEQRFDGFIGKLKTRILFYDRQNNKECTWKLTQKPSAFMDIVCSNINALGWGQYSYSVDASLTEMRNINFDSTSIFDALTAIAEAWGVEWWIDDDMTIHLSKCEHGESVTLALDNELVDMDRSDGSSSYATRLYAFGSTRNISTNYRGASSGSTVQGVVEKRLKLPAGIDYVDAWENMADEDVVEAVVNFDEIYPKRIGSITELSTKQYTDNVENTDGNSTTETWNAYRFKDSGITFSKNYIIPGQELRIVFQTGALGGMDFAVSFEPNTDGASGSGSQVWEIVRNDDYGINLPNDSLKPQVGDTYVLYGFDIVLVASTYVPAAEQELLAAARTHIQKICIENATFTCNTNPIKCAGYVENEKGELVFAAGNIVDLGIGQKVTLINDNQFGSNGFSSRVFAVEKLLCNKFSCKYSVGGTAKYSRLADIENKVVDASDSADKNKEEIRSSKKKLIDFTNRRFRDIQETTKLLEQSLLNFSGSINPMSVKAMQLLIGDESLQFRFVDSKTSPKAVNHSITFNNTTKRLFAVAGILQHLTIGIKNISPTHAASEYRYWDMADFTSSYLTDGSKPYYLYAEVDKVNGNGVFVLSEVPVQMDEVSGKYYLLVGILNSEFEGERSFVTLYGYSEILPGRITTEKIVSPSGNTFFDLVNDIIQGKITFKAGSKGLEQLEEWANKQSQIDTAASTAAAASATAAAAATAANTAKADAESANRAIADMASDGKLSPVEKQSYKVIFDGYTSEKAKYDAQADQFTVSRTAYDAAYDALNAYLTPLLADLTTTSDIVSANFTSTLKNYTNARTDLTNAIAVKTKLMADAAQEKVDNIQIGGRNYVKNGRILRSTNTGVLLDGYQLEFGIYPNETVTMSFYAAVDSTFVSEGRTILVILYTRNAGGVGYNVIAQKYIKTTPSSKIVLTGNTGSGWDYQNGRIYIDVIAENLTAGNGKYSIEYIQVEKGNKATDYDESPEDRKAQIDALNYLKTAIQNDTSINGGLVSTTLVKVGAQNINGAWIEKCGINGAGSGDSTVRIWAGGTLQEAIAVANGGANTHMTVITEGGKLFAVNAEISGNVNARNFTAVGADITATLSADSGTLKIIGSGSMAGIECGLGKYEIPNLSVSTIASGYFKNLMGGIPIYAETNASSNFNVAILTKGNIVSNASTIGYGCQYLTATSPTYPYLLKIDNGTQFILDSTVSSGRFSLPASGDIEAALKTFYNSDWCVRLIINCKYNSPDIVLSCGLSWNYKIKTYNGTEWDSYTLGAGDSVEFLLCKKGSEKWIQIVNKLS